MASTQWFSTTKDSGGGWRLDIVSLLAVIGESSIEEHSQAMTSSWTCLLPRIIPAPQVLLKPSRPTRMPQLPSSVVGIHNGTLVPTLNFFPNIIHPIEDLPAFGFKVYEIKHRGEKGAPAAPTNNEKMNSAESTSLDLGVVESAGGPEPTPLRKRTGTLHHMAQTLTFSKDLKPHIPTDAFSPLNIISMLSFLLSIGLFIGAAFLHDGTAMVAVGTISIVSSIVGYASWWSPALTKRVFHSKVPAGDVAIRTREGAFLIIKCNEEVTRELYMGTEECEYYAGTTSYRILVGFGTFLLMISVVLLGNCEFIMQAAIGGSYMLLNFSFWMLSLLNKRRFWDLSLYEWNDITPADALNAHLTTSSLAEESASFTRTMWYAIRETKKIGWLKKMGAAPTTKEWDEWLQEAEDNAVKGNRKWRAVEMREQIVGMLKTSKMAEPEEDTAEQHVPAVEIDAPATR
ncbi:hypothetical protein B0J14DRAFT_261661 [Halenospora varia]|nr:hypothetical protein B0J14DRAFT_261661 [Halenospora varia]